MCDFKIGDRVRITNLQYPYKDYPWLKVGLEGVIENELRTFNKRGARRFGIRFEYEIEKPPFLLFYDVPAPSRTVCCEYAKLYSDEVELVCKENKKCYEGGNNMKVVWDNFKNEIVDTFYTISVENISKRYEEKATNLKEMNVLYQDVEKIKKEIAKYYNISTSCVRFSVNTDLDDERLGIDEIVTPDCQKQLKDLEEKKNDEIQVLQDLCKCAATIVKSADNFEQKMSVLQSYKIVDGVYKINENYGTYEIEKE